MNLTEAANHIAYQLPNERTRVTQFLDSISCQDPELLAGIAAVRKDDPGMRDSFERMATFITPSCPVSRKTRANKRPAAEISATFALGANGKHGNSGVELRWYKRKEYLELTDDQRDELKGWAATQPDNRKNKAAANKANKSNKTRKATAGSTKGVVTVGSIKFKKLMRAEIKAINGKAGHYGPNKKDKESDALISAIKALATATATTASADVGSTKAVTIADPVTKVAEAAALHLRAILKTTKPGQ